MRLRVSWICVLACFLAATLSCAHADPNNDQYLRIFLKMNDAEQLEKQGDYRGALALFSDCYARLEKIHKADPDWERALVVKRIEDCQSKIAELTPLVPSQAPEPTPPPPPTNPAPQVQNPVPSTPPPPSPPLTNSTTNSDTGLSNDVTTLQQELIAMKEELETWKEKYRASQAENQGLKQQRAAVD